MPLEILHMKIEPGLKRRIEQAVELLQLRNISAFVRMAIAEKVNAVLGPTPPCPVLTKKNTKRNRGQ